MSGFENMRSQVNQFLHPSIDNNDRYDPTFAGLSHKRKVPGYGSTPASGAGSYNTTLNSTMNLRSSDMGGGGSNTTASNVSGGGGGLFAGMYHDKQSDQWLKHKGKRADPYGPRHDPTVLAQDARMVQPFSAEGDMAECRFGKGFQRRKHDAIDVERPRLESEAVKAVQAEERQVLVRQRHADRERPLNPLTWAPTTASVAFDTVTSRATNYVQFNRTAQTLSAANGSANTNNNGANNSAANSSVLNATATNNKAQQQQQQQLQPPLYPSAVVDRVQSKRVFPEQYAATVGPPATGNVNNNNGSARSASSALAAMNGTAASSSTAGGGGVVGERLMRTRNEGMAKPKEWGVAQQMKCGDGYVLPEIVPTGNMNGKGGEGQRVAKRQIRAQTLADTRPW